MKRFIKRLKLLSYVFLMVLASIGIAISGGIPNLSQNKNENRIETKIEMVETKKRRTDEED